MTSYGLPMTGASLTLGGVVFDQAWVLTLGVGLVLVGALVARMGFRRNKAPHEV